MIIACAKCRRRLEFRKLKSVRSNARGDHALACPKCGSLDILPQDKR